MRSEIQKLLPFHYFTMTFTLVFPVNLRHKCHFSSEELTERIKINAARLLVLRR